MWDGRGAGGMPSPAGCPQDSLVTGKDSERRKRGIFPLPWGSERLSRKILCRIILPRAWPNILSSKGRGINCTGWSSVPRAHISVIQQKIRLQLINFRLFVWVCGVFFFVFVFSLLLMINSGCRRALGKGEWEVSRLCCGVWAQPG